ncbi:brain acid soluble protein 1-like protein [Pyrus ussuriensis x Pyrus communis]|uniref:Brain acid soluble protein 1-like protein n=1 Tax=Pyrus ussuriensis x Pyrus communis TaxID=2448454 RepID=A0A5N5F7E0_9ROSA|nr:brain acid soluble protein 1-like protein [Pyrus ussuriensis x Pyrus communis]
MGRDKGDSSSALHRSADVASEGNRRLMIEQKTKIGKRLRRMRGTGVVDLKCWNKGHLVKGAAAQNWKTTNGINELEDHHPLISQQENRRRQRNRVVGFEKVMEYLYRRECWYQIAASNTLLSFDKYLIQDPGVQLQRLAHSSHRPNQIMGGCASKPKEFDTPRPEALPSETTSPKKANGPQEGEATTTSTTATTTEAAKQEETTNEAPLIDLSKPKEEEAEAAAAPAVAAEAEVVATKKPKEEAEVAVKQLAEINLVEAVKETKEKELVEEPAPKAKEEKPAADIKPKATEEDVAKAATPVASEDKAKDAPLVTV